MSWLQRAHDWKPHKKWYSVSVQFSEISRNVMAITCTWQKTSYDQITEQNPASVQFSEISCNVMAITSTWQKTSYEPNSRTWIPKGIRGQTSDRHSKPRPSTLAYNRKFVFQMVYNGASPLPNGGNGPGLSAPSPNYCNPWTWLQQLKQGNTAAVEKMEIGPNLQTFSELLRSWTINMKR